MMGSGRGVLPLVTLVLTVVAIVVLVERMPILAQVSGGSPAPGTSPTPPTPQVLSGGEDGGDGSSTGDAEPGAIIDHPQTLLDFAVAGGVLMIPLGLASVVGLSLLLERLVATHRGRVLPAAFAKGVRDLVGSSDRDRARVRAVCDSHPSAGARVVQTAVERLDRPREEIEQAVQTAAAREVHVLRRYTRLFAVIANVSPLVGLLGTVIGMIQAFRRVAEAGLGAGGQLTTGIYMALVTTAAGLLVAIPALLVYNWLMARVDRYVHELDLLVEDVVDAYGGGRSSAFPPEPTPAT